MADNNSIHFILTGGTIDSYYDGVRDTVKPSEHSIIPEFIQSLKLYESTEFTEVCMKDSRELSEDDFRKIVETVEKSPHKKFILTHGTYIMPDTAKYLKANLKRNDATIVFTGSLVPIKGFSPSDGTFNLGYSIAQVQILPRGICVCMNGKTFDPDEVIKLIHAGKFISVFGQRGGDS